jgi:hypothetical protein
MYVLLISNFNCQILQSRPSVLLPTSFVGELCNGLRAYFILTKKALLEKQVLIFAKNAQDLMLENSWFHCSC